MWQASCMECGTKKKYSLWQNLNLSINIGWVLYPLSSGQTHAKDSFSYPCVALSSTILILYDIVWLKIACRACYYSFLKCLPCVICGKRCYVVSKSVKLHGILFSLCTKSCKKCKVFEREDRNTNGVQKKPKQMEM